MDGSPIGRLHDERASALVVGTALADASTLIFVSRCNLRAAGAAAGSACTAKRLSDMPRSNASCQAIPTNQRRKHVVV